MNTKPDLGTLALMAASCGIKQPKKAVEHAMRIWTEAEKALGLVEPELPTEQLPKRWPASGKDFMRLVVRGRTEADSVKRLRDYFFEERAQTLRFKGRLLPEDRRECEEHAAGMVGRFRGKDCALSEQAWRRMATEYSTWWRDRLSAERRQAARKRG